MTRQADYIALHKSENTRSGFYSFGMTHGSDTFNYFQGFLALRILSDNICHSYFRGIYLALRILSHVPLLQTSTSLT